MVEPVRPRQTKGAATDMLEPKATASHLDSTKLRKTQCEHMSSGLPLIADIAQCVRHVRFVPGADVPLTEKLS